MIADVTEEFAREDVAFKAFKNVIKAGRRGAGDPGAGRRGQPRSFFDKLNEWARAEGAPGSATSCSRTRARRLAGKGPIAKFIPAERARRDRATRPASKAGDAVFFAAGEPRPRPATLAGKARITARQRTRASCDKDQFEFCWITDFPMYEWNEDEKKIDFSHNPFSMPNIDREAFLALDPADKETHPRHQGVPVRHRLQRRGAVLRRDPQPRPDVMRKAFAHRGLRRGRAGAEVRRHAARARATARRRTAASRRASTASSCCCAASRTCARSCCSR